MRLAQSAGLLVRYIGSYLSRWELEVLEHLSDALADIRLADEHRAFLAHVELRDGLPYIGSGPAGIGGSFAL